jgi:hypothetical protein
MFDMPRDAVRHLTRKGYFNRDENKYHHMRDLAFACAYAEIMREAPAADVRAIYFEVVAETKRDLDFNERLYADALRRTPALIGAGVKVVSMGSILNQAHERGWASALAAPASFTPPPAIELAIVKAKAADAYKLGRLKSREQARVLLSRFCSTVAHPEIKRELAKSEAALLAEDGWPLAVIVSAATFLGLGPADASSLAQWAVRKPFGRGARA